MLPSEYELNQLRLDILLALVQLAAGQGIPHEKVKEALFNWKPNKITIQAMEASRRGDVEHVTLAQLKMLLDYK
jgi:hypothetical protein